MVKSKSLNLDELKVRLTGKLNRDLRLFRNRMVSKSTSLLDGSFEPNVEFLVGPQVVDSSKFSILGRDGSSKVEHNFAPRFYISLENCFVDAKNSLYYDSNQSVIEESTPWSKDHLVNSGIPKPIVKNRKTSTIKDSGNVLLSSNGFYHWLIEDLPIYLHAKLIDPSLSTLVFRNRPPYVQDFLDHFKIEYSEVNRFTKVDDLSFISRGNDTGWPHSFDIDILRQLFLEITESTKSNECFYISREFSSRSPKYEKKLVSILKANGWKILYLERLSLIQQARVISTARVVCGVHGAGLANIVWMKHGTKVIEIGGDEFRTCYRNLASLGSLTYLRIKTNNSTSELDLFNTIEHACLE